MEYLDLRLWGRGDSDDYTDEEIPYEKRTIELINGDDDED